MLFLFMNVTLPRVCFMWEWERIVGVGVLLHSSGWTTIEFQEFQTHHLILDPTWAPGSPSVYWLRWPSQPHNSPRLAAKSLNCGVKEGLHIFRLAKPGFIEHEKNSTKQMWMKWKEAWTMTSLIIMELKLKHSTTSMKNWNCWKTQKSFRCQDMIIQFYEIPVYIYFFTLIIWHFFTENCSCRNTEEIKPVYGGREG